MTVIIQVYMPTSVEDHEVEIIYEELNSLIKTVKGEENLIILGDFNTSVGKGRKIILASIDLELEIKKRNITRVLFTK